MLTFDHPIVETGDASATLEAWRFAGVTDRNTLRGRLFVKATPSGASLLVELFRDKGMTGPVRVAFGTGAVGARLDLTADNTSRLVASVWVRAGNAIARAILFVQLASVLDVQERDDRIANLLASDPPEVNFGVLCLAVSRDFLTRIAERFPPAARVGRGLAMPGGSPLQDGGRHGNPTDDTSAAFWTLNAEQEWELTGLQNPGDYREWAILQTLALIWERKAQAVEGDAFTQRADRYRALAAEAWARVVPWASIANDGVPDRPVTTGSMTIRRG